MDSTLPKSERLSGAASVTALFEHGKGFSHGCLRAKVLPGPSPVVPGHSTVILGARSRIVVSVPKRLFKRAVKRNLIKRRIRESYRRQKALLSGTFDILFIYTSPEVLPYEVIYAHMTALLEAVAAATPATAVSREMQLTDNQKDT